MDDLCKHPMTPEEYKEKLRAMRFDNPFVHRALTAQAVSGWSDSDTYAILAFHALIALEAVTKDYSEALKRMPASAILKHQG